MTTTDATSVLEACSLIVVCVVALTGNVGLFIIVLKSRRLRTVTNYFILNLSSADILVAAVSMPITVATVLLGQWPLGSSACIAVGFLTILTFIASVMGLALIALNRYYYVVQWKKYSSIFTKKRVLPCSLFVWGISLALSLPPLFGWAEYRFIPGKSYCFVFWPSDVYYMYFMIAICFCGPLSVMTFSYSSIFMLTRKVQQRLETNRTSLGNNDNNRRSTQGRRVSLRMVAEEKKFTNTLIMVVACFIICWTPFVVTMFFDVYEPTPLPRQVDFLSLLLGYLNSMCNPIFYGLRNRKMKKGFIDLYEQCFPVVCWCKKTPATQINASATSNCGASNTPGYGTSDETPQPRNSNYFTAENRIPTGSNNCADH